MLSDYLKEIYQTYSTGQAREESYYGALKNLIASRDPRAKVLVLPKKTEAGNPDIRVAIGARGNKLVGYIEAKDVGTPLDPVEESEQLKRYLDAWPNVILTNFFEFRLYRNGEKVMTVLVGREQLMRDAHRAPPVEHADEFEALFGQFFSYQTPQTYSAEQLARLLAEKTRYLRFIARQALGEEHLHAGEQTLEALYHVLKRRLVSSLTEDDFADLFAQTVTYGLFAARSQGKQDFDRDHAARYIPRTIGLLHRVFSFISSEELTPALEWIVNDIAEVLAQCDLKGIIDGFHKDGHGKDPLVHFYETFLAVYDPAKRESRGVYYTPEPVVGFIIRSVHKLLQSDFNKADGLAEKGVTVLDPAAGTGTFLAEAVRTAVKEYTRAHGAGSIGGLVEGHILLDFIGFELMVAPYTIGHLKLALVLREQKYWVVDQRFRLYLTNTLDFEPIQQSLESSFGEKEIVQEQAAAQQVKENEKIMVVTGNPPYSGQSENKGDWITAKMEDYKQVHGVKIKERNIKWINDDYVKFIRFAEYKIAQNGSGILGYITNHAWLDNPTFRGMRAHLLETFDELYILNLHGNKRTKQKNPNGGEDDNVFDIQAGVAILLALRHGEKPGAKKVHYADLWGIREKKYEWLNGHSVDDTTWQSLEPKNPEYLLVPRDESRYKEYEPFIPVNEILGLNSAGIVTARDELTIRWNAEDVWSTIIAFSGMDPELARQGYNLGKDAQDWKIELAQKDIRESGPERTKIKPILYRPFDIRCTYYTGKSRGFICRPREDVMQHMRDGNIGLIVTRQNRQASTNYFLVTDGLVDFHVLDNARDSTSVFPLYTYNDQGQRTQNFKGQFWEKMQKIHPDETPEDVLGYLYAIMHAPQYREKYAEFLKSDFPRVPITADRSIFAQLARIGRELIDLHLMRGDVPPGGVRYEGSGSDVVSKPTYDAKTKRVWVNKEKYFENIAPEVWEFMIGGYQVMQKWLKDRADRTLGSEDQLHYARIAKVIESTIALQKKIDEIYPEVEKSLLI